MMRGSIIFVFDYFYDSFSRNYKTVTDKSLQEETYTPYNPKEPAIEPSHAGEYIVGEKVDFRSQDTEA